MHSRLRGWFVGAIALALVFGFADRVQAADDDPIEIKPRSGIDERVFAIRVLEDVYAQWPRAEENPLALRTWIQGTGLRLTRIKKSLEVRKVDSDIVALYSDCITLLDQYEEFLIKVGRIRRGMNDELDMGMIGLDAAARGFGVIEFASRIGISGPYAVVAGAVVAIGSGVYDWYAQKEQLRELNQQQRLYLDDLARQMNNRFERAYAGTETAVRELTRKNEWGTQAGFDGSIRKPFDQQFENRPQDPFIILTVSRVLASDNEWLKKGKPADILKWVRLCQEAARWVPAGDVYDPFRAELVAVAAHLNLEAAALELDAQTPGGSAAYSSGPVPSARQAVRLHRTYLALELRDPARLGKRELARALAMNGQYQAAVEAANDAFPYWKNNIGFAYRYARLMSLTGKPDKAAEWLRWAYQQGWSDIPAVANDPDLANLRTKRPDEFRKLTTVNTRLVIEYGVFDDDIVVYNDSPFALTNVTIDLEIKQPNNVIRKTLKVSYIGSGGSYKWVDAVSVPGSTFDSAPYQVKCDQNR